jgi:hypothetical protein
MTFMYVPYEQAKNKFHTTIIVRSWPMKFVMMFISQTMVSLKIILKLQFYFLFFKNVILTLVAKHDHGECL